MLTPARFFLIGLTICLLGGCGGSEPAETAATSPDPPAATPDPAPAASEQEDEKPAADEKEDDDRGGRKSDDDDRGGKKDRDDRKKDKPPAAAAAAAPTPPPAGLPAPGGVPAAVPSPDGQPPAPGFAAGLFQAAMDALTAAGPNGAAGVPGAAAAGWTDQEFQAAMLVRSDQFRDALKARTQLQGTSPEFVSFLKRLLDAASVHLPSAPPPRVAAAAPQQPAATAAAPPPSKKKKKRGGKRDRDDEDDDRPKPPPQAKPAAPAAPAAPKIGSLTDRQVVESIVEGLLTNNSAEAWTVLRNILHAEQQTPLTQAISSAVVFEQLCRQEQLNTEEAAALAGSIVESTSLNLPARNMLTTVASRALQMELHMERYRPDAGHGTGALPLGGRAASRSRRGGKKDRDDREDERPRAPIAAGAVPGAVPDEEPVATLLKITPASAAVFSPVLRHERLISTIRNRLQTTPSFTTDQSLYLFASMMPDLTVRYSSWHALDAQHDIGAQTLLTGRMYKPTIRDPAHLVVLKSLPRQRKDARTADPASVSWAKATWQMVQTLQDQLSSISSNPDLAFDGSPPLRLHRGAVPQASIRLSIDDGYPGTEETPPGTQVYYSRCSVIPTDVKEMKALSEHYANRTKGHRRELRDQGVLWFDGVRQGTDGTRMSMDVVIRQANTGPGQQAGPGSRFTIETITVVAMDPRDPPMSAEPDESDADTEGS